MVFAFLEDGMVDVHANTADAKAEFRLRDVESRAVVFYDEDGTYLEPAMVTPRQPLVFGLTSVEGEFDLVRCDAPPPEIDLIDVALSEATGIRPNNFQFKTVEDVRGYIDRRRKFPSRCQRPDEG